MGPFPRIPDLSLANFQLCRAGTLKELAFLWLGQDFGCDLATGLGIAGAIHSAHAASADGGEDWTGLRARRKDYTIRFRSVARRHLEHDGFYLRWRTHLARDKER